VDRRPAAAVGCVPTRVVRGAVQDQVVSAADLLRKRIAVQRIMSRSSAGPPRVRVAERLAQQQVGEEPEQQQRVHDHHGHYVPA
jgi:hypothetical protein